MTKHYFRNQIELIDDGDKKEWMKSLCVEDKFLFTYNGITNNNSNYGHDIKEFWQDQFIVMEFSIYSINFQIKKNPSSIFSYKCRF